jgi:hypothetical protein
LIFEVILYFCRRGQENLHTLKVSDFEIKIGVDRYKSVQKITSELDKIHQGDSFLHQALSDSTKLSLGCTKRRLVPLCLLERYFSNDALGHIAFPGVSYILPPVPSMSLITLFRDDLQKLYKHPRALTPDIPLGLLNKLIFFM